MAVGRSRWELSCSLGRLVPFDDALRGCRPIREIATTTNPTASAWTSVDPDGSNTLYGISCTTSRSTLCVAVDNAGNVVTSTNPTGGVGAWTVAALGHDYSSVSCPSASECVAFGDYGAMAWSTNPTGGTQGWTTSVGADIDYVGVDLPFGLVCVSHVTQRETSTPLPIRPGGRGVCRDRHIRDHGPIVPDDDLFQAVDYDGYALSSTDPTGGASAWTTKTNNSVDIGDIPDGISCASNTLCVVTDSSGKVVVWTNVAAVSPPSPLPSPFTWASPVSVNGSQGHGYEGLEDISCRRSRCALPLATAGQSWHRRIRSAVQPLGRREA